MPDDANAQKNLQGCLLWMFGGFFLFFVLGWFFYEGPGQSASKPKKHEPTISPGTTVQLVVDGNAVAVATESQFYSKMVDRLKAGDGNALGRMMAAGQVFSVKNGTKALVISPGVFTTEVRILDGNHKGDHGIVNTAWLEIPVDK